MPKEKDKAARWYALAGTMPGLQVARTKVLLERKHAVSKILLVEDNEMSRGIRSRRLEGPGSTAHAMVGEQEHSLAAGGDDSATILVDLPRLLTKIQAQLTRGVSA